MARIGLGDNWRCVFANEWCERKAASYRSAFGAAELNVRDVAELTIDDLPEAATLIWASFPCQDLSLAGSQAGLNGQRSGAFKPFWRLISSMEANHRAPGIVVLENVVGAITSRGGDHFAAIFESLAQSGYRIGPLVIDAARFLPQSRPRLFFVAVHRTRVLPGEFCLHGPSDSWHTRPLRAAHSRLPDHLRNAWVWWSMPESNGPIPRLGELLEDQPSDVAWHTAEQTDYIIEQMSPIHLAKLEQAKRLGKRVAGTIYMRTREDRGGARRQRAEVRFDQIAGCLRTPAGGSSRQLVVIVEGQRVRTRLLSPREAARLMGVPDSYALPENRNDAYRLLGDGLAVPVVSWLEGQLLRPLALADLNPPARLGTDS